MPAQSSQSYFVTGFPGFIGRRLVQAIAEQSPEARLNLLVEPSCAADARRVARALPRPERVRVLEGDVANMHLGLSGAEYGQLCDEVTDLFHLAALRRLAPPNERVLKVNVEGTRNALELARDCRRLRRFSHFSSAFVCGERAGVVAEDELDARARPHNRYEESKLLAEQLVRRAARELPVAIFRPSIVVGDSRTGEIDRLHLPYRVAQQALSRPWGPSLPAAGAAPVHLVPVDYVVAASLRLSQDPRASGRTFHLVDPNPMSARRLFEALGALAGQRSRRPALPARLALRLSKLPRPGAHDRERRELLGYASSLVWFNAQNAFELLDGTPVRCPPLASYLPRLFEFGRGRLEGAPARGAAPVEDPLDDAPPPEECGAGEDGRP